MKFGIDIGHNCPPDIGSTGIRQEDDLTKEVGILVIEKLTILGHQVVNCTPSSASSVIESLKQRVERANSQKVELLASIHFNCFNGQASGSEAFSHGTLGKKAANLVLKNIVNLGFSDRGVKDGSNLYVLKNTEMPSILIECCFCDSKIDMELYNPSSMADAIAKGLSDSISI
ncbi:N-acetylmuramoyl-L-alanine amidase [Nostoc sp. CCY 9925]|uniref:N-acetylmuramoyl-L-alanine amidase n=1 Tax=Nostoc sp. CCY 9925 TaxID=3103865 RepID=UPI0039C5FA46